jgi:hypothetical protein
MEPDLLQRIFLDPLSLLEIYVDLVIVLIAQSIELRTERRRSITAF